MEKILVIFGGKSVEHDISIITGLQAMRAIKNDYKMLPIYVDDEGKFWTGENLADLNIYADFHALVKNKKQVLFNFGCGSVSIKGALKTKKFVPTCALVCMHGTNGEDGTISAILAAANICYTCPDMASSAICMDKAAAKIILKAVGLPVTDFVCQNKIDEREIVKKLSYPIIVKPARCGSSIGIQKCANLSELKFAIDVAKNYDTKLIFEHFIENRREFNCACMIFNDKCTLSKVCEVKSSGCYSFDEKYLQEKPSSTFKVEKLLANKIKLLTKKAAQALECEGVIRVDFLMDEEGEIYINEINTIPGSLAFYLFGNMREVCCELIEGARQRKERTLITKHQSQALSIFAQADMNNYTKK